MSLVMLLCVLLIQQDPATKYYGHLLLANIIAKFAIHKRIVLQVLCVYMSVCTCAMCIYVCVTYKHGYLSVCLYAYTES